jgi:hypothetical protein
VALRVCPIVLFAALLAGCDETPAPPAKPRGGRADAATLFDAKTAADVAGVVRWAGPLPTVPAFRSIDNPLTDQPPPPPRDWPNPNAPRIDRASRGLSSAVVFLRGIDPRRARPWDLPAVRIELRNQRFHIAQGASDGHIGFVRTGDAVDVISRDARFHLVQARGAAFFARTLCAEGDVRPCRLEAPGVVELVSGCGYFWMRAYLFVADHPYHARCDAQGRFRLPQVPPGDYELVAWHPDWRVTRQERNPDNFRVQQVRYESPLEAVRRVAVRPGRPLDVAVELSR